MLIESVKSLDGTNGGGGFANDKIGIEPQAIRPRCVTSCPIASSIQIHPVRQPTYAAFPPNKAKQTRYTDPMEQQHQIHSHSANTHHLALLSASTKPLHVPLSPTLITVSQLLARS